MEDLVEKIISSWLYLTQIVHSNSKMLFLLGIYRKRPCISRIFFHKIEAKNGGCGLSMDISVFPVLKNLINIDKTS